MAAKKQYKSAATYESKLKRVMERLGISKYNYNWDRFEAWIEFVYKGALYRFEHSVEKARKKGINLSYGTDAFAQLVLTLEDIAQMTERGIYELNTWVEGLKYLPPPVQLPSFFQVLGFDKLPTSESEINDRFKVLAKQLHPDLGGTTEDFINLKTAVEQCLKYLRKTE